jgi:hypothetical protein
VNGWVEVKAVPRIIYSNKNRSEAIMCYNTSPFSYIDFHLQPVSVEDDFLDDRVACNYQAWGS